MSEHVSAQLIERYRQRRLEPVELLALDEHVSDCAACRLQMRAALPLEAARRHLQASVQRAPQADDHPALAELRAHLRGQLAEVDRELIESHLEFCAACQTQAQTLRFASQAEPPRGFGQWLAQAFGNRLALPLAWRVAGALALLTLLVWGVWRWRAGSFKQQEFAGGNPTPAATLAPSPPAPALLWALNDGAKQVTLDAAGKLSGLETLAASEQQLAQAALTTARVEVPQTLAELKNTGSKLMGQSPADPAQAWAAAGNATLRAPFSEVLAEDRPVLRWQALAGAESYVVTINEPAANYREVAVSPKLTTTRWQVSHTLPRGRLYIWQVAALVNGREVSAPAPQAPEAKFRVLAQTQADELANARKNYAGQHLPLGLLYARLGLLKEAERELQALAADNPQASIVQKLLHDLRSKRP